MRNKWLIAVLAAALLALPGVGANLAQAKQVYTGWAPATDLPPLHPAGFAKTGVKGKYLAGDLHNHTTGTDGSTSAQVLIDKAMGYGLDWFAQSGHGGRYDRDLRESDPEYDGNITGEGNFWVNTVSEIKGIDAGTGYKDFQNMWRWQAIQEFLYPITWHKSMDNQKPIWAAFEWQVPGHEHCSLGIITGQYQVIPGKLGNANALAQFEYLFDMEDNDTSEGGGQGWTGKIPNPPKSLTDAGIAGHAKALEAAQWMAKYHKLTSYMLFTHTERKGAWNKDLGGNNTGYNVEHFRDFNNAAPNSCFGFETMPGHQAEEDRGGYGNSASGGGAYGGTGIYAAKIGGMWDALLSEGRNWWLFGSSDWHGKGVDTYNSDTNPNWLAVERTNGDFWPGEFQKDYVFVKTNKKPTPQDVLNGMRSGNSFVVQGDLIRDLDFTIKGYGQPASMGEKLTVGPNQKLTLKIKVRVTDPKNPQNNCPYSIDNPSLAQKNIHQPLNQPMLHHIDIICGQVTGKIDPSDTTKYTSPVPQYTPAFGSDKPTVETILVGDMKDEGNGWKSFTYKFTPKTSCYFRLRGTNLPPDTPNETDKDGNPLCDTEAANIPNIRDNGKDTDQSYDVAAWSDLWFYSNPIFIRMVADPNGTVTF